MTDSQAEAGKLQEHLIEPETKEMLTERWDMSKGHKSQVGEVPIGQCGTI